MMHRLCTQATPQQFKMFCFIPQFFALLVMAILIAGAGNSNCRVHFCSNKNRQTWCDFAGVCD